MYKMLIVDDEQMIRMGIKEGIEWKKMDIGEVYTAASASEALRIIREERPELMITDISMAEMTGLDLIREIRRRKYVIRIIVLTGYDSFNYARQCLKMQVQNFLLKPVDEEELTESVRQQVEYLKEMKHREEQSIMRKRTEGSRQQMELERLLRSLITREEVSVAQMCADFHLNKEQEMCAVLILQDMDMGEEDRNFRLLTLKNICIGLIDARNEGLTFLDHAGRIVVAVYQKEEEGDITETLACLKNILEDEDNSKVKFIKGSTVKGFEQLYLSYNDAVCLLDSERAEFDAIISDSAGNERQHIFRDVYEEFKKAMVENTANCEHVLHIFDRFRRASESYNISDVMLKRLCFELASSVMFAYTMDTGESRSNLLESVNRALLSSGREETMKVMEGFLSGLLGDNDASKENNEIISRAKIYIGEHLEENLSVAVLAESFYVSPNYFSRLFKRVEGEGCNEYIVRKRIERSMSLLETTTLKTGRIAMMVGYNDTNYFSIAFKKHTGMSPTKYREMCREKGGA